MGGCACDPDVKPGPTTGVLGGCDGVLCGSGSLSEEVSDGESEEEEDDENVCLVGGRSPSSSSRGPINHCDGGPDDKPGPLLGRLTSSSIGGGSSICIWVAVRYPAAVGGAPKSTYRDPDRSRWLSRLDSDRMSYVRVSGDVAIRKCSGAALIRVPAWLSHATMGAPLVPFSTTITFLPVHGILDLPSVCHD